jgi:hypothetical protein
MHIATIRPVLWGLCGLSAALGSGCSDAFSTAPSAAAGRGGASSPGSGGKPAGSAGDGAVEAGQAAELGGAAVQASCLEDDQCADNALPCVRQACVDGECVGAPLDHGTPCPDGACDGDGECVGTTCGTGVKDGDETGVDCGGSCALCPDGQGCRSPADCLSGVCNAEKCQASACTDKVENGTETGVDCGGSCALKCPQGQGCKVTADCAVAAGDLTESVRCVQQACVSTKPPSQGGVPLYWQDFAPQRLVKSTDDCSATDDVCLLGNGAHYQMFGIGPTGANKALTKELVFTNEGAVGSGGKFDGTLCLTRIATSLTMADRGAMSAMAWIKSTRKAAPWESAILGSPAHYVIAVDANPASLRFLAALVTTQSSSFDYRSSTTTNEVVTGQWHHVAQVYDTASAKMLQFVNGAQVHATTVSGNVNSAAGGAFMGCRKDAAYSQFFIGTLDEVVVYPRALSAAELADYVKRTAPAPAP